MRCHLWIFVDGEMNFVMPRRWNCVVMRRVSTFLWEKILKSGVGCQKSIFHRDFYENQDLEVQNPFLKEIFMEIRFHYSLLTGNQRATRAQNYCTTSSEHFSHKILIKIDSTTYNFASESPFSLEFIEKRYFPEKFIQPTSRSPAIPHIIASLSSHRGAITNNCPLPIPISFNYPSIINSSE